MPMKASVSKTGSLSGISQGIKGRVSDILEEAGALMLSDMKLLTPRDTANPGKHAVDGLTMVIEGDGLRVLVGLPNDRLASEYFWFRFLDGGTAGGTVTYRKGGKRFSMNVPARPALHILERAKDGRVQDVERLIRAAIAEGQSTL
ncbi:MAG: hypothetical protein JJ939_12055 [Alphaproteobacteria bacterium]|nr:hypothetical protein [Alphaproteobacteria bacterium]MBO6629146.1 hypothetical protein [Alphaproteobacteria bacterium]